MDNHSPYVSVIVPVYNAESSIQRCVESVLSQPFKNLELILVDDGSKDLSPVLCDEFSVSDPRVKVIHKSNGGVSSARNAGMHLAPGQYITFVDADDWLVKDTITEECFSEDYDVIRFPSNTNSLGKVFQRDFRIDGQRAVISYLKSNFCNACWGRFYKSSLVKSFLFDESVRMGEDLLFFVRIIPQIRSFRVIGGTQGYVYSDNPESATYKLGLSADLDTLVHLLVKEIRSGNHVASVPLFDTCFIIAYRSGLLKSFVRVVSPFDLFRGKVKLRKQVWYYRMLFRFFLLGK